MTVSVSVVQLQEESLLAKASSATITATSTTKGTAHLWHTRHSRHLQLCLTFEDQQRFRIGDTQRIAQLMVSRTCVAISLIGRVFACLRLLLIQMNSREAGILVTAIAPAELRADSNVTALRAQSAIYLQLAVYILIVVISKTFILSAIDHQSFLIHLLQALSIQRINHMIIGIGIESSRGREIATVAGLETHIRTERQRGH